MNTRLSADESRLDRLRTLTEVSRALTYTTSPDTVLDLAVRRAAELMGAERALIMLSDEDGLLTVRAAYGLDPQQLEDFRAPLQETLIYRLQGLFEYPLEECFLSVPLVARGQVTGLLAAVRPPGDPCTSDDELLLSALADQAAVALENARLVEVVREEREDRNRLAEAQGQTQATLSHELRSPLTAIQSYSSLLLEGLFGPLNDRQRESISRIRMSGQHLLTIIENVWEMARVSTGVLAVAKRKVLVDHVLTEAVQMLQPRTREKEQELQTDSAEDLAVRGDADALRQALVNLIGNAIKYTPQGGNIGVEVSTTERDGEPFAAIAVIDNGRGMSVEVMATIFEPYDRGEAGTHEAGLGLGLYISRELVRQMGGEIEAQSEPGSGSTLTVLIPLWVEEERERS